MNKFLKWILWIVGILVLAAVFFGIGYFAYTHWNTGGWMMSMRGDEFRGDGRLPWRDMPNRFLPRERTFGFLPVWFILGGLFRLAIPVLIIIGVIALVLYLRRNYKVVPVAPATAPTPVTASAPVVIPAPVEESKACASCGRAVQADWIHCPYCGNTLS